MRFLVFVGFVLAIAGASESFAQIDRTPPPVPTEATFGPAPDFVIDNPPMDPADAQFESFGGARLLLLDAQHDSRGDSRAWYRRVAIHVENATGVSQAATVETSFNPAYQQLVFHHIRVIRDGQVEDRQDRAVIEFARLETERDRQIFNGEVNAVVRLDDVRVGDVVDTAYSITGTNPVFGDEAYAQFPLSWPLPIEALFVRSIWNPGQIGFWDVWTGEEDQIEHRSTSMYDTFTLEMQGRDALDLETGAPGWTNQLPTLRLSSFANWQDVAEWARPIFELETSTQVEELAGRFRSEHDDPEEQLLAALRFVQDEIRYLAIAYGQGSYVPATPDQTLEWRYGDCKAKTVLFVQLARELGFEADAALVGLMYGHGLGEFSPDPGAFDHVIARVRHGRDTYWLDPTVTQQGGTIESQVQADYGWALPLDGQSRDLVSMERDEPSEPTIIVNEHIDMTAGAGEPVTLEVETIYTGMDADNMRYQVASLGRSGTQRQFLDFYNRNFGEAEFDERITIEDDREANRLVIRETVWLGSPYEQSAQGGDDQFNFLAHSMGALVDTSSERRRDYPLMVLHPSHVRHVVHISLPQDMRWNLPDERVQIDNAAFDFSHSTRVRNGVYTLEFELETKTQEVPGSEALEVLREHEDMLNNLYYGLTMPRAFPWSFNGSGKPDK